jgi:FKBP-type peptidyl-prolyl cis-trans isomerase
MASRGRAQRIFIWIIAITMAIGSVGAYFLIILANENEQNEVAEVQQQYEKQLRCQAADVSTDTEYETPEAIKFNKEEIGDQVEVEDVKTGAGKEIDADDACVAVHYQGNLSDGTVFDGSYNKEPIAFTLDGVIAGWQEGMQGMKEGGRRVLKIPSELAYGEAGSPPTIKPNEPLLFTIDLIRIQE